jgi:hypothetical protein
MKNACENCGQNEATFIAVSKDYQRMREVCDACFEGLADEGEWFFAPAKPDLSQTPPTPKKRSA